MLGPVYGGPYLDGDFVSFDPVSSILVLKFEGKKQLRFLITEETQVLRGGETVTVKTFSKGDKITIQPMGSLANKPLLARVICDWETSRKLTGRVVETDNNSEYLLLEIPTRHHYSSETTERIRVSLKNTENLSSHNLVVGEMLYLIGAFTKEGFRCVKLFPVKSPKS